MPIRSDGRSCTSASPDSRICPGRVSGTRVRRQPFQVFELPYSQLSATDVSPCSKDGKYPKKRRWPAGGPKFPAVTALFPTVLTVTLRRDQRPYEVVKSR